MTRRLVPQTRYTLRRNTVSTIKDLICALINSIDYIIEIIQNFKSEAEQTRSTSKK